MLLTDLQLDWKRFYVRFGKMLFACDVISMCLKTWCDTVERNNLLKLEAMRNCPSLLKVPVEKFERTCPSPMEDNLEVQQPFNKSV